MRLKRIVKLSCSFILIFLLLLLCGNQLKAQTSISIGVDSLNFSQTCSLPVQIFPVVVGEVINNNSNSDSLSVTFNWGDGSSSSDSIPLQTAGSISTFNVNGNFIEHTYTVPGTYTVQLVCVASNGTTLTTTVGYPITISNGCSTINGFAYIDANANCVQDPGENLMTMSYKVLAFDATGSQIGMTYSNNYLNPNLPNPYSINVVSGLNNAELSIDLNTYVLQPSCPISGAYTFNSTSNQTFNFGFTCNSSGLFSKSSNVWGYLGSPGSTNGKADLFFRKYGCNANLFGDTLTLILPQEAIYLGMATIPNTAQTYSAPDVINGDTLIWYADSNTTSANSDFISMSYFLRVNLGTDTSATIFNQVPFTLSADTNSMDPAASIINDTFKVIIGGPYDPNNKISFPQGQGPLGLTDVSTQYLTYLINFQNTGTAPAVNVFIIDSLSEYLDWNSVEVLSESHRMKVIQFDENKLKFQFSDINLPDSNSNEPASHGNLMYRVKLKDGLPIGTSIENTAHIFFDYNEAIVTNTAVNTLHTTQPLEVLIEKRDVTCLDNENGRIDVSVLTGNPPYVFHWSDGGSNSAVNEELSDGLYTVSISDALGYSVVESVQLSEDRTLPSPVVGEIDGALQVQSWNNYVYSAPSNAGSSYSWDAVGGEVLSAVNTNAEVRWFAGPNGQLFIRESDQNGCLGYDTLEIGITFLGTEELTENGITIFPNPASEKITIQLESDLEGSSIQIIDMQGRIIYDRNFTSDQVQLDVSHLARGMYTLRILNNGKRAESKFIVN